MPVCEELLQMFSVRDLQYDSEGNFISEGNFDVSQQSGVPFLKQIMCAVWKAVTLYQVSGLSSSPYHPVSFKGKHIEIKAKRL